jgi:hypothetical protein
MNTRLALALAGMVAGCSIGGCGGTADDRDASVCFEYSSYLYVPQNRSVDILLVVDSSSSMVGEASRLEDNLERFAQVLENIEGALPDVHIGVVSADVAARGGRLESMPRVAGCEPPADAYLIDIGEEDGERASNYTGTLAETLACIATLPATGGDIEQPLEAARRALDGSNPANVGFLREHAYLMVVFIGDEDDCSGGAALDLGEGEARSAWQCFADGVECDQPADTAGVKTGCAPRESPAALTPIADYVSFFRSLKPDPLLVLVAAVTSDEVAPSVSVDPDGPVLDPSCTLDTAEARPAPRLRAFLDAFPQRSTAVGVCQSDWSEAMVLAAELLARTLGGPPCLQGPIDLDPATEGIQHECVVSQVRYDDTGLIDEALVPECTSAEPPADELPCFRFEHEPDWCHDTATGAMGKVLPGPAPVLSGTFFIARCFTGCE